MTRASLTFLLLLIVIGPPTAWGDGPGPARVVGYLPSWTINGPEGRLSEIHAERLTHLNYAFVFIDPTGRVVVDDERSARSGGAFEGLRALKAKHPRLRTLISVGGWGGSARFSDVAQTEATRARFAESCARFVADHGFDGVDIDWEYPTGGGKAGNAERPDDAANFPRLLLAIRAALDALPRREGRPYEVSIAATDSPGRGIDWKAVVAACDFINTMSYDMAGPWTKRANFQAPLRPPSDDPALGRSVVAGVQAFLAAGVPREKLVVGVPFYGRGWVVADAGTDFGLFGRPAPSPPRGLSPGFAINYRDLKHRFPAAERHWSDRAKSPWLFDPARKVFIGYDDAESLRLKAAYVRDARLGGVMIWEVAADDPAGTLLEAVSAPPPPASASAPRGVADPR